MANISLDIKANTQKALGEFKKLSRELDNKFLVQGLKLDVVKSAFRDITKQFDAAVGEQGFKTAESGAQLRRSLALNLVTLKRFSGDVANAVSKDLQSSLRALQAEGKIAGEAVKEALNAAAFFDFAGGEAERRAALKSFTNDFALFAQQTKNLFGSSDAGKIQRILTGQSNVDELFGLDFSAGGAVANRLNQLIRERVGGIANLSSIDPKRRSQIAAEIIREFRNSPEYKIAQEEFQREQPFAALRLELQGLFSPEGAFGALRELPGELKEFGTDRSIPRTLLAATGKLLRTIFDREEGLFAILNNTLKDVFGGGFDVLNVIVSGVELLTAGLEKLGEFFQSASFKKFLNIFVPIQEAFDGILSQGFQFDRESINGFISNLFEALRNLIKNVSDYITNIDKAELGSILGNIVSQIGQTLVSLIPLVFNVIGAAIQTIGSSGALTALGVGAGALGLADTFANLRSGQRGGVLGAVGRDIRGSFLRRTNASRLARERRRRERGGGRPNRFNPLGIFGADPDAVPANYISGNPDLARGGGFTGWQGEVIRKFNQIIIIMRSSVPVYMKRPGAGGGGFTTGMGGNPMGPFGPDQDSRVERADNFLGYQARRARVMSRRQASLAARGARRLPGRFGRMGRGLLSGIGNMGLMAMDFVTGDDFIGSMADDYMDAGTQYLAPIGPLPLGSSQPWAEGLDGGFEPRMDSASVARRRAVLDRYNRRMAYRRSFGGRMGQLGRGVRGLGRLGGPVVGGLLTAFSLASLFGGSANASEMEGMTQEEKNEERRARDRQVIGGLAGIAGGAAGGALLGSAFGPVGTVLGGIIGGFVGEEAVKSLSDPIIDGIGNFGRSIGDWFGNLWEGTKNLFGNVGGGIGKAWEGIVGFFGEEGPIQRSWRFTRDAVSNIGTVIQTGWDEFSSSIASIPGNIWNAISSVFSGGAPNTQGRALGGAGRGLTLVGENGPELVDLGTGSVVYPMTSFGGSRGGRGTTINNVTININAPGAELFANELSSIIVDRLDELYEAERSLGGALA